MTTAVRFTLAPSPPPNGHTSSLSVLNSKNEVGMKTNDTAQPTMRKLQQTTSGIIVIHQGTNSHPLLLCGSRSGERGHITLIISTSNSCCCSLSLHNFIISGPVQKSDST